MSDYVLYRLKYRHGNAPLEQTVIEILDRGKDRENRDAAELLGREWLIGRSTDKGLEYRFIDVEKYVSATERATVPVPAPVKALKPINA